MGMNVDDKSEVGGQIPADLRPLIARIIAAHDIPVLLHEQRARTLRVHGDMVHAVSHFGVGVRDILRA